MSAGVELPSGMQRDSRLNWFRALERSVGVPVESSFDLLAAVAIPPAHLENIKRATQRYVEACLRGSVAPGSEQEFLAHLDANLDTLVNRTPNGILMPKREFVDEFNRLHKAVASWLESLQIGSIIDEVLCPIVVRIVKGRSSDVEAARPYASTKLHVDLWGGEPADNVAVSIPLFGDVGHTTLEFFHPPDDFESHYLRVMPDYDDARAMTARCVRYPVAYSLGSAYFWDAIVLHRTVQALGMARISLQFTLRRVLPPTDRAVVDSLCDAAKLTAYLKTKTWFQVGKTKAMVFDSTLADAAKGVFPPYGESSYHLVDSR